MEWVTPAPHTNEYFDTIILSKEEAIEYGDELVWGLRVDGEILEERGLDPQEPFAWKVEDGELLTKQISRQTFEDVAESDREDSCHAQKVLEHRAKRRLREQRQ